MGIDLGCSYTGVVESDRSLLFYIGYGCSFILPMFIPPHYLVLVLALVQAGDLTGSPPESSKYVSLSAVPFIWDYIDYVTRALEWTSVTYQIWAWKKPWKTFLIFKKARWMKHTLPKQEKNLWLSQGSICLVQS